MIKPLAEYSPEERAFVEWVQQLRNQPPKPPHNPGPWNPREVEAILAEVPQAERRALGETIRRARGR
jgi:hypothetical protein